MFTLLWNLCENNRHCDFMQNPLDEYKQISDNIAFWSKQSILTIRIYLKKHMRICPINFKAFNL